MSSALIGKGHNAHLDWLLNDWMTSNSSPVCFLEGFPGTGKTMIARTLQDRLNSENIKAVIINAPETQKDPTDDLLLELATELNSVGRDELAQAIENNRPLLDVLSTIVNDPILIIIDEFQNTMLGSRPKPSGGFAKVLGRLANRKFLKGRFLLLTNRLIERARWSEPYVIRTLKGMDSDDGLKLLDLFAKEGERTDEIYSHRREDVVKLVGGNPRALRTIISNLAYDSLDDLIGDQPELWELCDRKVSSELVEKLEEELLRKTLDQLPGNYVQHLNTLSVIRKPFKRQAIELLFSNKADYSHFKKEMIDRFLMDQHKGWFNLHPIVREIGLNKLSFVSEDQRKSHALIAPYYMRHFKAKQIRGWGALGSYFVEARFHLIRAGKGEDLRDIASRFQSYIFSTLSGTSPIPKNPEELDERIAVLSSLLESKGPKKIEYHLARLFQARNQRNDLKRALHHAYRSKSNIHVDTWLLCSDLLCQMGRIEEAISNLIQGTRWVQPEKGLVILYDRCAQLLYEEEQQQEAIKLLKQGINQIPPEKAVVSLYERCGRYLYQMGEREEAIKILKNGMEKIPPDKALVILYTLCGNLFSQAGQYEEAIEIVNQGIKRIPPDKAISDLYYKAGELLLQTKRNQEAVSIFREGIDIVPHDKGLGTVYARYCELLYQGGELENAIILLKEGINRVSLEKGAVSLYLYYAKLLLISNQHKKAIIALVDVIKKVPSNQSPPLVELLLILYAASQNENGIAQILEERDDLDSLHYSIAKALLSQIQQSWSKAARFAEDNRISNPLLQSIAAFSWLCAGQPERGLNIINNGNNFQQHHILWLKAFIHLRLGNISEAKKAIAIFQNQTSAAQFVDEVLLLNLWDNTSSTLDRYDLSYYFPILPTSLTGLKNPVFRIPYSPPVLSGRGIDSHHIPVELESNEEDNSMKSNRKVFISYSSKQKTHADDLHYMLEKAGYYPFLDSYDITGGQNIPERIATLINKSEYFVLLLSEESLESSWVLAEITLAYSAGLLREERLLPVQLGDIDDKRANSIPWIPRNSYNWLDGTKGLRPVVNWLDSK